MERVELVFDRETREILVFRNAWIPNYQARRVDRQWLLTNASGSWHMVCAESYARLRSVAIPLDLFKALESRHLIVTESNSGRLFDAYKTWTTPHFRHPGHHIIVATLRCNLACSYCHAAVVPPNAGDEFDLDIPTAEAILDFALNSTAAIQSFEFQGGESLLNGNTLRHIIPLIRTRYEASGRRVYLFLQTNATLLTKDWMAFLKENGVRVGSSMDGPKQVHDRQRLSIRGTGTHDRVATQATRYKLGLLPTITRHSLDFWREIVDEQLKRGETVITFQNVYPINSAAANWADVGIDFPLFLEYYERVVNHLRSLWTDGYYPLERRFVLAVEKLVSGRDTDFADFGSPCGMVHSQIVYHTNGDVYTCDEGRDFHEFRLGNVKTDAYEDIVFGRAMRELKTLSIPNDQECLTCAYRPMCSTCPVYDRAVTGELTSRHAGTDKCVQTKYIYDTLAGWIQDDDQLLAKIAESHQIHQIKP